eukprot:PITA_32958
MFNEGIVLGRHISKDGIKVDSSKVEVISKLSVPIFQKNVRSFLGFTGYYRIFIENFTKFSSPLFKLLTKDCEFNWDFECQVAFETLKKRISEAPVLKGPNLTLPFHISTDASYSALGVVLGQQYLTPYAIYYTSKSLNLAELNYTDIFTCFGVPREVVTDQGTQFTSRLVQKLVDQYKIKHWKSTPYHPQANGKVESTNKVIKAILTKTVHLHRKDWVEKLPEALWAYRTTWRNTTGHTPYELVYGKQVLLPIEFQIETYKTVVQLDLDLSEAQKQRMTQLNELNEIRQEAF